MLDRFIEADGLHKTYVIGKTPLHVLSGASFAVEKGQTVAVVGKSGAGKSTFLHILGGLDRPQQGNVLVKGQDLYAMHERSRSRLRASCFGFVFQSYHLLSEMDVLENVMLPGMARRKLALAGNGLEERAMRLLGKVGLVDRADHTPLELSGGEQQRVALARALMNRPEVLLADEPTGNLDATTGGQVLDYLFEMVREEGLTLVLVTHNRVIAKRCDRLLLLNDGKLQDG